MAAWLGTYGTENFGDIGVTLNVYTHLGLEDAATEMARMEAVEAARREQEKVSGKKDSDNTVTQKMFRAV